MLAYIKLTVKLTKACCAGMNIPVGIRDFIWTFLWTKF